MKLISSQNDLVCKSAAPAANAKQKKLQAGYPQSKSYYLHQEAYHHGWKCANWSFLNAKYVALLIARLNEAFADSRHLDVYQLRQRFYWRFTKFSRSLYCERCRFREWLLKKTR